MGKMSELCPVVTELRNAAQALISVADALADLFSGSGGSGGIHSTGQPKAQAPAPAENPAPAQAPAPKEKPLTLEAVRAVLADKSRSGYTAEVRALLEKHGAAKLSEIDPAKYPALLGEAEGLGNG